MLSALTNSELGELAADLSLYSSKDRRPLPEQGAQRTTEQSEAVSLAQAYLNSHDAMWAAVLFTPTRQ